MKKILIAVLLLTGAVFAEDARIMKPVSTPLNAGKKFNVLSSLLMASTAYNAHATSDCIVARRCQAGNIVFAPNFETNRLAEYEFNNDFNTIMIQKSLRLKEQGSKRWALPLIGAISIHLVFGSINAHRH